MNPECVSHRHACRDTLSRAKLLVTKEETDEELTGHRMVLVTPSRRSRTRQDKAAPGSACREHARPRPPNLASLLGRRPQQELPGIGRMCSND